jgi:sugar phosphate isomerase/epimerase
MEIKIFAPRWGHEHVDIADFSARIKAAGYDGLEAWLPDLKAEREHLFEALDKQGLLLITHQHQAHGPDFSAFKDSFLRYLHMSAEGNPLLINSHTGRDYFSFEQNLELIDIAAAFGKEQGIEVVHETHRGRMGFGPGDALSYMLARPELRLTADLSHWVCVTESFLENFSDTLDQAIARTRHVHARIGFEEGPQVPDPRAPEWVRALDRFLGWWDRIVAARRAEGAKRLTFTTEFGPPPYLPTLPFSNLPVADQFEINCFMKDLLRERYVIFNP